MRLEFLCPSLNKPNFCLLYFQMLSREAEIKKSPLHNQTARTPLTLRVGPEDAASKREKHSAETGRSVSPPFSVASGLETPSPCPSKVPSLQAPTLAVEYVADNNLHSSLISVPN